MMEILKEGALGGINSVYSIAKIIIPIMIILQILKDYKILDKIIKPFAFITKMFKTSDGAVLPLLVGLLFGLSYGAGVIIQSAKEGDLTKRDLLIITIFLATCHAVFEDTLIFVAVGANGFILLGTRIVAAVLLTYVIAKRSPLEKLEAKKALH